jgi:choline kinase
MKVLIMAAGVGSRISRHLHGQPKCCVDVGGKPLIKNTFEQFNRKGLHEIAIVTGYQDRYIHQALEGFQFARYFNPFYRVANSVSSVWFARDFLVGDDDILIMNGDVFMEDAIIDIVIEEKRSPVMLCDSSRIEDADYRFYWEGDLLKKYGKELGNEETTGEYVGIGKLNARDKSIFRQRVIDYVAGEDYGCWWEDVIYRTINAGEKVYVRNIAGHFWAEVDYIEDYERIRKFIAESQKR